MLLAAKASAEVRGIWARGGDLLRLAVISLRNTGMTSSRQAAGLLNSRSGENF
jgi:hypothetical protein